MVYAQLVGTGMTPTDIGFDFPDWRPHQLPIAERILNTPKKIIVLNASTGFGKSAVVQIPARVSLQRQLILTRTKALQTQYERDGIVALYGRDNYACNANSRVTAALGVCRIGIPCAFYHDGCNYFDQKRFAIDSDDKVLNYAYFFLEANGPGQFGNHDYIICDEAHCVPEELAKAFSIRIYFGDCKYLGIRTPRQKDLESLIHWARRNLDKVKKFPMKIYEAKFRAIELFRRMGMLALIDKPEEWVTETVDQAVIVRPIWPDGLAAVNLWPHASKFILASATINPDYTLPMLGMSRTDAEIIEAPSIFEKHQRPIFIRNHIWMNHKAEVNTLALWLKEIDDILDSYGPFKGLIHTGNYQLANLLLANSKHQARLIGHNAGDRLVTLERFKAMTGSQVLVSPSMTEGVDLPYDNCRFQIIAKVPYPNKLDKVWEARFAQDEQRASRIYTQATIDQIVQAAGRGMRAADDYCETWIIDANITRLLSRNTSDFPKFFREAIHAA